MNLLFGLRLKYFNGVSVLPTAIARDMKSSDSFGYAAENLVRLIKLRGLSYAEVPVEITERKAGKSKAFAFKNIYLLLRGLYTLERLARTRLRTVGAGRPAMLAHQYLGETLRDVFDPRLSGVRRWRRK